MKREGHFHLHVAPVYKSRGQSAVASAAYQSNQKLTHKAQKLATISANHARDLNKGNITDTLRQELSESPIFTMEADGMDQLAAGTMPSEQLAEYEPGGKKAGKPLPDHLQPWRRLFDRFEEAKETLSGQGQLWQTQDGWTLYDKDHKQTWHLYEQDGAITVCRYHGITLSQQATATKDKRDNWTIEDGPEDSRKTYKVRQGRERKVNEESGKREYTGKKWIDVYGDKVHDYTDKGDVEETWVQAPACAPEWIRTLAARDGPTQPAKERQRLWQWAEDHENARDGRPATKIELALPRELTLAQSRQAVREFVGRHFTSRGIIADVAIHAKKASDGKDNIHCHMLFFTRELEADGTLSKTKNDYWISKQRVVDWRKGWEEIANQALDDAGSDVRIDHRSHKARGLNKVPGVHLGPSASAMEEKGVETDKGDINRDRRLENNGRSSIESMEIVGLDPWQVAAETGGAIFQVSEGETPGDISQSRPRGQATTPDERHRVTVRSMAATLIDRSVQAGFRLAQRLQHRARNLAEIGKSLLSHRDMIRKEREQSGHGIDI